MKKANIQGVNIDLDSPDIKNAKTAEDIDKLNIFGHFNDNAKKVATQQLLDKLSQPEEEKATVSNPGPIPPKVPNTGAIDDNEL